MSTYFESGAYPWALTGVFAALHFVVTLIPFSLSVGTGGFISFGLVSSVIVGYLLGPIYGTISVLLGSFLGMFVDPALMVIGLATPIATASGAISAGLIRIKKPVYVFGIYLVAMIFYLLSPIGLMVPEFLWFIIIVFILMLVLVLVPFAKKRFFNEVGFSRKTSTRALFLVALIAVCADELVGSTIGAFYFVYVGFDAATVAGWWTAITFVYPVERLVGALIATILLAALVESISSGYFRLPGMPDEEGNQEIWANE